MRVVLWILLFLVAYQGTAQDFKRNWNWAIGFWPIVKIKFNGVDTPTIDTFKNGPSAKEPPYLLSYYSAGVISDTNANLEITSTGFSLLDRFGFFVKDSKYINCVQGKKYADFFGFAATWDQTEVILPRKGNQYYVISVGMSDKSYDEAFNPDGTGNVNATYWTYRHDNISYSIVDMDSNQGLGQVISKNNLMLQDQWYPNPAGASVKHGNGKDWWYVKEQCIRDNFQTFLVTADSIYPPFDNKVEQPGSWCGRYSYCTFSEQGDKMLSTMYYKTGDTSGNVPIDPNRVDVFNFDRCTGKLSLYNTYNYPLDSVGTGPEKAADFKQAACFSPDGNLMYISNRYSIWQVDLNNPNTNNAIKIYDLDTNFLYFPWYYIMKNGPDGRLYIGNEHGTREYMSYIEFPNIRGKGCNFCPQCLWQPFTNIKSPPNMPNYGLGAATNSPCDTIRQAPQEMVLYPNPTTGIVKIKVPTNLQRWQQYATINVYSMQGQRVQQTRPLLSTNYELELDLSGLAKGVYTVELHSDALLGGARKLWKVVLD